MTPEETKEHVRRRLSELGLDVYIGKAGYEKIFRITGGAETEANRICHELISLGAAGGRREITDAVVDTAVTDMTENREEQRPRPARTEGPPDADRISIERLAAVLEAKLKVEAAKAQPFSNDPPRDAAKGAGGERSQRSGLPKALVAQAAGEAREKTAGALARDFRVIEAPDGERAWRTLLEQPDIAVVVIDLALSDGNGYDLTRRIRGAAARPHLAAVPVVVIGGAEDASAKAGALRAGATDFVPRNADPRELRARVLAQRRAERAAGRESVGRMDQRPARRPADVLVADRRDSVALPRETAGGRRKRVSAATMITLSATVLLGLAIAATFYVSSHPGALRLRASDTAATPGAGGREGVVENKDEPDEGARAPRDAVEESPQPPAERAPPDEPAPPDETSASPPAPRAPLAQQKSPGTTESRSEPRAAENSAGPPGRSDGGTTSDIEDAPRIAARQEFSPPEPARSIENAGRAEEAAPARPAPAIDDGFAQDGAQDGERTAQAPPPREPPAREPEAGPADTARAAAAEADTPTVARGEAAAPAPGRAERERAAARTEQSPKGPARAASPDTQPAREAAPRTEVAAAAPPSPDPPPPSDRISKGELVSLVQRFASVYEAGDLEQFLGLFARNARTNDRNSLAGIRKDYEALFRSTDLRQLSLGELSWEVDGNQAYGRGEFDVKVRRQEDGEAFLYTGSLTLVVEKVDGRVQIIRLFHGQERARS